MSEHKALFVDGKDSGWRVGSRPTPHPGKGEVLVKALSVGLNPIDWKRKKTGFLVKEYPYVPGVDASGVIAEIGEDVSQFKTGDRVLLSGNLVDDDICTFQQYILVPTSVVAKIPDSLTFDQAASIPLSIGASAIGLYDSDPGFGIGLTPPWAPGGQGKYKGQSIVVYGGSSSVGQTAIQLAVLSGFSSIIAICSSKHEAMVRSYGATHFVDRKSDIVNETKKILSDGAVFVYDAISTSETQANDVKISKPSAAIVLTLSPVEGVAFGARKVASTFGNAHIRPEVRASLYKTLPGWLDSGAIKPNPIEVLPGGLGGIGDGELRLENDQVSGVKLVAHPWD